MLIKIDKHDLKWLSLKKEKLCKINIRFKQIKSNKCDKILCYILQMLYVGCNNCCIWQLSVLKERGRRNV